MKVLIVEDERRLAKALQHILTEAGYEVTAVYAGDEGLHYAAAGAYDLIVLDVMLPGMDGYSIVKALRQKQNHVPVLMLTAKSSVTDKVTGLDAGADDYITKPFYIRELMARVKANIRRSAAAAPAVQPEKNENVLQVKDLTIDMDRHAVYRDGKEIDLTEREYNILQLMAAEPGKIFSREELMRQVWQYDYFGDLRTVDVAMRRFREKLEKKPAEPEYIMTRRGAGYYFAD